jgi:hypothetical protein
MALETIQQVTTWINKLPDSILPKDDKAKAAGKLAGWYPTMEALGGASKTGIIATFDLGNAFGEALYDRLHPGADRVAPPSSGPRAAQPFDVNSLRLDQYLKYDGNPRDLREWKANLKAIFAGAEMTGRKVEEGHKVLVLWHLLAPNMRSRLRGQPDGVQQSFAQTLKYIEDTTDSTKAEKQAEAIVALVEATQDAAEDAVIFRNRFESLLIDVVELLPSVDLRVLEGGAVATALFRRGLPPDLKKLVTAAAPDLSWEAIWRAHLRITSQDPLRLPEKNLKMEQHVIDGLAPAGYGLLAYRGGGRPGPGGRPGGRHKCGRCKREGHEAETCHAPWCKTHKAAHYPDECSSGTAAAAEAQGPTAAAESDEWADSEPLCL